MAIKFGTDGWRAIIDQDFNDENVKLVSGAIAKYFEAHGLKSIAIGFDGRNKADFFAKLTAEIFANEGIKVFIVDKPCPTPTTACLIVNKKAQGGIMFTASHNPPEFLGLKYMTEDGSGAPDTITNEFIKNLENLTVGQIKSKPFEQAIKEGLIEVIDPKPGYFETLKKIIDVAKIKQADFKVLFNAMHGSGATYLPDLLSGGKLKLECLNCDIRADFGGVPPEPVLQKNLIDSIEKMKNGNFDICLAADGDADRVGAIDEKGKMITSHEVFLLLAYLLVVVQGKRAPIVGSLTHTVMVQNLCKKYHLDYYETKVGFKWVAEKMKEVKAVLGSEESGGSSIQGFILVRDSQLVHLLLLELMIEMAKPISEILKIAKEEAGGEYVYKREDLHFPYEGFDEIKNVKGAALIKNPPEEVIGKKVVKIRTDDGLKLFFADDSWLLIRFSGTEPTLRIMAEGRTMDDVEKLIKYAKKYFEK